VDSIKLFSSNGNKGKRVAEINRRRAVARQGNKPSNTLAKQNGNSDYVSPNKLSGDKKNAPATKPNATRRKKSALKTALIVVMIIILGLATFFVALGFYVSSLDAIFPNIYVNGVRMSGMVPSEASEVLGEMVESSETENLFVTVSFATGGSFVITGVEAGLSFGDDVFNPYAMAHELFSIGREGSFFQNEISFIRTLFNTTEITIAEFEAMGNLIINEVSVRSIV
jgi:hypothetical protein